ncbi:MAG: hypothetical protein II719_03570 [Clostridia bacterium]|nr:hypothetical protein [Clostridia bacterium]
MKANLLPKKNPIPPNRSRRALLSGAAVLLALLAASCGNSGEEPPVQSAPENTDRSEPVAESSSPETEEDTSASEPVYDIPEPEIPETDFGGAVFRMCEYVDPNGMEYPDLWAEKLTGEIVNDAVFNRNLRIEERFHVKMDLYDPGLEGVHAVKLLQAGDNSFALIESSPVYIGDNLSTGVFLDLTLLPYCDFSQRYWNASMREGSEIYGQIFMMGTDFTYLTMAWADFIYFNKQIQAEYDLENPYDLVHENRWTLENYLKMIASVSRDLNGDGVMDEKDLYGAMYHSGRRYGTFMQLFVGCGLNFTKSDGEGSRVVDVDLEKAQTVSEQVREYFHQNSLYAIDTDQAFSEDRFWGHDYLYFFTENHALFAHETMKQMNVFREMEADFGVVPNPKYDESQESYRHRPGPSSGVIAVPTNISDATMVGAVLEYGAWLSHYTLIPAYYEVTIKTKRTRDETAMEMLDIIHDTIIFDIGDMYDSLNMAMYIWNAYESGSFPRSFGSVEKKIQKSINKLAKLMEKVNG